MEHGIEAGETCCRDGCLGEIEEHDAEYGCHCNTGNAPCSHCTTPREYCETCGWDANDEMTEYYTKPKKEKEMDLKFIRGEIVYRKRDLKEKRIANNHKETIGDIVLKADGIVFYQISTGQYREDDLVSQSDAMKYRIDFLSSLIAETAGIKF